MRDDGRTPLKNFEDESFFGSSNAQILVSGFAWMLVLVAATHRSESPVVFGLYSLRYAALLACFVVTACMVSLAKLTWLVTLWQARAKIFVSGASLLVTISLAEVAVRAVDAYGVSYYDAVSNYMLNMEADKYRIYRHKASSQQHYGKVTVTYNEHGLRDRPILPKGKEEFRILALGDSIAFGWGVPQDQIFPVRLEQLLQSRLGRPVRVINSGVGGYNTVQELAYFKQEGITFQPDLVVLTYVENDIDETPPLRVDQNVGEQSFLGMVMRPLQKMWLYRLVQHAHDYGFNVRDDRRVLSPGGKGWDDSMIALDELASICRAHNVPLIIFYYRLTADTQNRLLNAVISHVKGFPVKDIGPWFAGRDLLALIVSKIDPHPNAEAHRFLAEHMAVDIENFLVMQY
jgi:lysophospholipase L1-like esterase